MKKVILLFVLATLLVAGCGLNSEEGSGSSSADKANSSNVLRIGAQPYPLYASIYVAKEKGYLDEELKKVGATYEWTDFKSGPLVNEAVASGHDDIGFMADMPAILAKSSGQDIQIIADVAYGEKALALLAGPGSDIVSAGQLKGKKVAYGKGTYAQHLLALLLEKENLTFNDIQSVNIPAGDIPAALESGQIDAAVIWEPFISQLVASGKAKVIADGTGIKRGNLVTYAVKKYAEENPQIIAAYIKACQRASDYIKSNPKEAAELIAKDMKVDPLILEDTFKNLHYDQALTTEDVNEIKKVKDYLLQQKLIQNDIDMDSFINLEYLKEAGIGDK
ncbi:aliphatic sulfonate ABC transporter substrate-binding protein [Pectinatus haikarae]|uniref:Sulfonate transport system substrate-binding protein n=1 Tax=Pectinatus haikarae TaxID=349096 RepID=A0ABT9Y9K9_9FIRM|nr:aliphatic sulfonate ABC transporter substrate-binding protein [Pectinatus haikarae]MDQ0204497.1 sulfonate transport system substrate-binding protein [Pectinatus haikarae]